MSVDINAPEVQEAIRSAVDEAVAGLKNKNTELLSELKAARKNLTIDPEDYGRLKDEKDSLLEKISELNKSLKTSQIELDKVTKLYQSETSEYNRMLVDNSLTVALGEVKVKPELLKAVKALVSPNIEVKDRQARVGDKSISDYIKEWSVSDEGKHFVMAPINSGGNSSGAANGSGGQKQVTRSQFDGMNQFERSNFAKSGGSVVDG